jgi:hypothetical protein
MAPTRLRASRQCVCLKVQHSLAFECYLVAYEYKSKMQVDNPKFLTRQNCVPPPKTLNINLLSIQVINQQLLAQNLRSAQRACSF